MNVTLLGKMRIFPRQFCQTVWQVGRDDPRRIIHSLKVGFSLTLVSLLYLMEPVFEGIGKNAIWAVMTVVVVFEFTVGATLRKGLNRGLGTILAGSLAYLMEYIGDKSNLVFHAVFIGVAVFFIGTTATYIRFVPYIKKSHDYGVLIFLLTFNLITVSSYRADNVLQVAHERFYTIAIGVGICLLMSLFIFPSWSGDDLHNLTITKLESLSKSIEACMGEYFQDGEIEAEEIMSDDPVHSSFHKSVLDSKSMDETLALHASWEPIYTRQCHRYPWQQYVKCGTVLRHFGYTAVSLHGCLQSEIQTPRAVRAHFKIPCVKVAGEVSKVLMELANSIRNRQCFPEDTLSDRLEEALKDLNDTIKSQPRLFLGATSSNILALATAEANRKREKTVPGSPLQTDSPTMHEFKKRTKESEKKVLRPMLSKLAITSLEFSEALPFAAFASLLLEMVVRLDLVIEQVQELGRVAQFKEFNPDLEIVIADHHNGKRELQLNLASEAAGE